MIIAAVAEINILPKSAEIGQIMALKRTLHFSPSLPSGSYLKSALKGAIAPSACQGLLIKLSGLASHRHLGHYYVWCGGTGVNIFQIFVYYG